MLFYTKRGMFINRTVKFFGGLVPSWYKIPKYLFYVDAKANDVTQYNQYFL